MTAHISATILFAVGAILLAAAIGFIERGLGKRTEPKRWNAQDAADVES